MFKEKKFLTNTQATINIIEKVTAIKLAGNQNQFSMDYGDFNHDQKADLLYAAYLNSKTQEVNVVIFFAQADGSWEDQDYSNVNPEMPYGTVLHSNIFKNIDYVNIKNLGDVNGDGVDDIGLMLSGDTNSISDYTKMYVILGQKSPSVWPSTIDLENMASNVGYTISPTDANEFKNSQFYSGADVNGDGKNEIVMSAKGCVLIVYGSNDIANISFANLPSNTQKIINSTPMSPIGFGDIIPNFISNEYATMSFTGMTKDGDPYYALYTGSADIASASQIDINGCNTNGKCIHITSSIGTGISATGMLPVNIGDFSGNGKSSIFVMDSYHGYIIPGGNNDFLSKDIVVNKAQNPDVYVIDNVGSYVTATGKVGGSEGLSSLITTNNVVFFGTKTLKNTDLDPYNIQSTDPNEFFILSVRSTFVSGGGDGSILLSAYDINDNTQIIYRIQISEGTQQVNGTFTGGTWGVYQNTCTINLDGTSAEASFMEFVEISM